MSKTTEDQKQAADKLESFHISNRKDFFVLGGSAGTGKTWLIKDFVTKRCDPDEVVMTAPTNKAVTVLEKGLPPDFSCMTIHKFLGLTVEKYEDTTRVARSRNYDPSQYAGITLVGLDEASMADDQLVKYIKDDVRNWGRKYIIIGDPYQLPPVDKASGTMSSSFDLAQADDCKHTLHKIVRQAEGSPIIRSATVIRDAILANQEPKVLGGFNEETGEGVFLLRTAGFRDKLQEYTERGEFNADPDFCRIVSWRNDTVNMYNQLVRQLTGQDMSVPFCPGDVVTVNEALARDNEIIFNTGAEVTVSTIEMSEHPIFPDIPCWCVNLFEAPGMAFYVLHEDGVKPYKDRLERFKKDAYKSRDWRPYYGLREFFLDLRPLHALTVHKSQGSTFENVFIDLPDIYHNSRKAEADRCFYTAITRASKNVYIRT